MFVIFYYHLTHHGSAFSIMYFYNKNTYIFTYLASNKRYNSFFQGLTLIRKKSQMIAQPPARWRYALSVQMPFEQKKKKKEAVWHTFVSVRFHSDSSIHRSVEKALCVHQEHTLG